MTTNNCSRRSFIKKSAAGSMLLSGAAPVFSAPKTEKAAHISVKEQSKALVFIMLDGGNDSFNMLVPVSDKHYSQYKRSRSNLALSKEQLLNLDGYKDAQGRTFALHDSMPEMQQLFHDKKLAFVANTGPLIEPVSKQSFHAGSARLPLGLMSHSDQFKHWQSARPGERINRGWFGYFADALQPDKALSQIPMNISLAGNNIMQNGVLSSPYSINQKGSVGLIVNEDKSQLNSVILDSFEQLLKWQYPNDPFKQSYLSTTRSAQSQHQVFSNAVEHVRLESSFSDTDLSQQLAKVAQSIKAADRLGHKQQTYFLRYIGWDHHDELLSNHKRMLRIVSRAMSEFQTALQTLEIDQKVVTFTGSDFGRTLTSNGNGTDHGWGGNIMVMGTAVNGGRIYGQYPSLALGQDNPLDIGDGVLIPTTAIDQVYASIAKWFGADDKALHRILPNLSHFSASKTGLDLKDLLR
ncbi:DUF1501 domain-containing protein [Vibrio sp. SCSIO 43137]|uniref:DUF1501 domain-containing protein n=1 Tax=Vibrio sp. SCSIO 43137 TaxID=3021011 RepID=UPI0023070454|nr:DUF1501 domain-containing protein [Vibrio sp. SCSIO 43137]WCE32594.1 DUF1501 domain-containing protein [Vibrio sp. SCSIO 43137]